MTEPTSRLLRTSSRASADRPAENLHVSDPLPYANASEDWRTGLDGESAPSTPRWVKAFGIVAIVLVLLFVGMHFTGIAPMHTPSGGAEHGMQAP
jgi:hypothetical protein